MSIYIQYIYSEHNAYAVLYRLVTVTYIMNITVVALCVHVNIYAVDICLVIVIFIRVKIEYASRLD